MYLDAIKLLLCVSQLRHFCMKSVERVLCGLYGVDTAQCRALSWNAECKKKVGFVVRRFCVTFRPNISSCWRICPCSQHIYLQYRPAACMEFICSMTNLVCVILYVSCCICRITLKYKIVLKDEQR
jgi:hypothetical protein